MRRISLLILGAAVAALAAGCAAPQGAPDSRPQAAVQAAPSPTPDPDLGSLKITDEVLGTGTEAVAGKKLTVNYTGRLLTGAQFDSSIGRGPFSFTLGAGEVIKGWDMGLTGMKVGGKRMLVIPSYLGYGDTGQGPIPPNATLVFDIELLDVE
ncbi:MAG TPA: FKBP-type peptidyl-prolyl cis-trans isomerase [bacterium]|jgi:FKBP-type peptidyl-prolyl cis-trans isomerase FkpA|nr:FKBP-type peptidyl-prolyl cis-trans isomerase [bacterium]